MHLVYYSYWYGDHVIQIMTWGRLLKNRLSLEMQEPSPFPLSPLSC